MPRKTTTKLFIYKPVLTQTVTAISIVYFHSCLAQAVTVNCTCHCHLKHHSYLKYHSYLNWLSCLNCHLSQLSQLIHHVILQLANIQHWLLRQLWWLRRWESWGLRQLWWLRQLCMFRQLKQSVMAETAVMDTVKSAVTETIAWGDCDGWDSCNSCMWWIRGSR